MSLEGKVAFITGAARGQGRAHAVRLAREGVKIIGIDICEDISSMDYPNASEADLAETVKQVEAIGGAMIGTKADVREYAAITSAVDEGVERYGRLDIVIANAGIVRLGEERMTSCRCGTTSSPRTSPVCSTRARPPSPTSWRAAREAPS